MRVHPYLREICCRPLWFFVKTSLLLRPLCANGLKDWSLMDEPIILHSHIPKTAGTTVAAHLSGIFGKLHLCHFHSDTEFVLTTTILETLFEINPLLRSLSSHHLRVFPIRILGRPAHYITFLRDPTQTLVSLLSYTQRNHQNLPAKAREFWPKETPRLPLRDLAGWFLDKWGTNESSGQSRFFCRQEVLAKYHISDCDAAGLVLFEIAEKVLSQFLFVGIVEDMAMSIDVLDARLRGLGIKVGREAIVGKFRHHNRNRSHKHNLPWLCEEDEVGRRVLSHNTSDRMLYSEFRKRLWAAHKEVRASQPFIGYPFPCWNGQMIRDDLPEDETLICEWAARMHVEHG